MSAPIDERVRMRPDVSHTSVGDLLGEVTRDLSTLVRQEVLLAKVELREEVSKTGKAAGMLGGAALAGYLAVLFASIALWWGLANVMDQSWAALIVAGLWAIAGLILYGVGRSRLRQVRGLRRTAGTVSEIPDALKGRSEHTERMRR